MATENYFPLETAQVPAPVLEEAAYGGCEEELPRILRQAAAGRRSARKLLLLAGVFACLAALEAAVYRSGFSDPSHLEVYRVAKLKALVEDPR